MDSISLIGLATGTISILGWLLIPRAILIARTSQAAIGWTLALLFLPGISIPLFLIFGESRFSGYSLSRTGKKQKLDSLAADLAAQSKEHTVEFPPQCGDIPRLIERLRGLPATRGNRVRLLVDGDETFNTIFQAIEKAETYVIVQFFIIHDDNLGRQLQEILIRAMGRGVKVWVLYDQVGSKHLPDHYCHKLRRHGARVSAFTTNRQLGRRFQINFRNHRKLVLVDGKKAYLGGLNAGDEYMGRDPYFGPWRDTHLELEGPAVPQLKLNFAEDWQYASGHHPDLPSTDAQTCPEDVSVAVFASGPADPVGVCPSVYLEAIHTARQRLWIASPYFVPDFSLLQALNHAALRGVDVRIILPQFADHLLPWLSSFTYYPAVRESGVKLYRYQPGFMHQKVLLADNLLSIVGSVNLDYRSFMLNFELSAAVADASFASRVEEMFHKDFARSRREDPHTYDKASFFFRLKTRLASLMSPEQ